MSFKRSNLNKLLPGEVVRQDGIIFTKLSDGDGRWSVNVLVRGRRHHRVLGLQSQGYTLTQAKEFIVALKAGVEEESRRRARKSCSVMQAASLYMDLLRSHGGRNIKAKEAHFRLHIVPALGAYPLAELSPDHWDEYRARRREQGAAPATINRERSTLLHLVRTAVKRKWIAGSVLTATREPESAGKLAYLAPAQLKCLLAAASEDMNPLVLRFVMIGGYTGMRQEAILQLRVGDVDCVRRTIRVVKDKAGARDQPMPKIVADFLSRELDGLPDDAFVFPSSRSRRGRVYQMNTQLARCVKRAGLSDEVTRIRCATQWPATPPMRVSTLRLSKAWEGGRHVRWSSGIRMHVSCKGAWISLRRTSVVQMLCP